MASQLPIVRNRVLHLYNTYTKLKHPVFIKGLPVKTGNDLHTRLQGSFYICGPTVYDHCHVGHALTYIRADLFRKFMRNYLNVDLVTVMNITDIDDKILDRSNKEFGQMCSERDSEKHHFKKVSDRFFGEFLKDLESIRVQHADIYMRITDNMKIITEYIRKLESAGCAYSSNNGDIYFNVTKLPNYIGSSTITMKQADLLAIGKKDPRDFVVWKSQKENEPSWPYVRENSDGKDLIILGRPGWHVQCSALASYIFGNSLDFHFGGKDLIFPHHYNETACCCAYHNLDPKQPINNWCNHWLHSGHLIISDEKMSKSLGNVIGIKDFIGRSSINSLRLLCVIKHYSTDLHYDEELITNLKNLDHKLNSFSEFLRLSLKSYEKHTEHNENRVVDEKSYQPTSLSSVVDATLEQILEGVCDGFNLSVGLDAILELSKIFYSDSNKRRLSVRELKSAKVLLSQWFDSCGLDYGLSESQNSNCENVIIADSLARFRNNIRQLSLSSIKDSKLDNQKASQLALSTLQECDKIRAELDSLGIVMRDYKSS